MWRCTRLAATRAATRAATLQVPASRDLACRRLPGYLPPSPIERMNRAVFLFPAPDLQYSIFWV